jgi:hypothetical protein
MSTASSMWCGKLRKATCQSSSQMNMDGFKTIIEILKQEYDDLIKKEISFGQAVPENMKVLVDI